MTPEQKARLEALAADWKEEPTEARKKRPSRRALLWIGLAVLALALAALGYHVLTTRPGPPSDLTAVEAADLACFHGWEVNGAPAYAPQPREVLVASLSRREANDFLEKQGVLGKVPTDGLGGFLGRVFVVVVHGPVLNGTGAGAATRGQGLVLVEDADGSAPSGARFVAIGPPWNTVAPPGATALPVTDVPRLGSVSLARARIELAGQPPVALPHPPDDLSLWRVTINLSGLPVDPSGTEYPGRSVTLTYADPTGRPRLWLTEPAAGGDPRILGRPLPLPADGGVVPYAWHAGTWEIDGFAWHAGGRSLFLTAEPGPDLALDTIRQTVESLSSPTPTS